MTTWCKDTLRNLSKYVNYVEVTLQQTSKIDAIKEYIVIKEEIDGILPSFKQHA